MPIPWMGSKKKIAPLIYDIINNRENEKVLFDVFCGGLAISEYFSENNWIVFASDANKYLIALEKEAMSGFEDTRDVLNDFVTRDEFKNVYEHPEIYADWYIGYLQSCWTFGNKGRTYVYGKETEPYKHMAHDFIMFNKINKDLPLTIEQQKELMESYPPGQKRRQAFARLVRHVRHYERGPEHLERLQHLDDLDCMEYDKVPIWRNAVIYCDPPYRGTERYGMRPTNFDHDKFFNWCRQMSKTNPIYISEYDAPDDFKCVAQFPRRSTLAAWDNTKLVVEKLFTL